MIRQHKNDFSLQNGSFLSIDNSFLNVSSTYSANDSEEDSISNGVISYLINSKIAFSEMRFFPLFIFKNDSYCWICHSSGKLICCDFCPRVYHAQCIDVDPEELNDNWLCVECDVNFKANYFFAIQSFLKFFFKKKDKADRDRSFLKNYTQKQFNRMLKNAVKALKYSGVIDLA